MKSHGSSIEEEYLKIAIQTVLYRYRNNLQALLKDASSDRCDNLLQTMAEEITVQARTMKKLTDDAIRDLARQELSF